MEVIEQYQRWKRKGILLVWLGVGLVIGLVILLAVTATEAQPDYSKLGIHLLLDDGRGSWDVALWDDHMEKAGELLPEGGYVVQLVRADDLDPEKWQVFLDLADENQLTPIIRLATVFDEEAGVWEVPQADADGGYATLAGDYAGFISVLDWHSESHYVILLNEPNNGHEWGGKPDAEAYARFVMDVAGAIRAVDEEVVILNGSFDLHVPNTGDAPFGDTDIYSVDAETFMDAMQTAQPDIFRQFDVWNSHVYPLHFVEPPWKRERGFLNSQTGETMETDAPRGVFNRSVNGYEWELWKLSTYGVEGLSVMVTETGWRHSESVVDSLDVGEYPDVAQVTDYLDLLLLGNANQRVADVPIGGWTGLLVDERVVAVVPFALNGRPDEWGHTNWLEMSIDGVILGEYPMVELFREYSRIQENRVENP